MDYAIFVKKELIFKKNVLVKTAIQIKMECFKIFAFKNISRSKIKLKIN